MKTHALLFCLHVALCACTVGGEILLRWSVPRVGIGDPPASTKRTKSVGQARVGKKASLSLLCPAVVANISTSAHTPAPASSARRPSDCCSVDPCSLACCQLVPLAAALLA